MREYFEASRRTYARVWPDAAIPGGELFDAFRRLRPVILSGWEMPLLLRAIAGGRPEAEILGGWETVRDEVAATGQPQGDVLVGVLQTTLDDVRREWIATDRSGWLDKHAPYCPLEEVRRLVAQPERTILVTTKEGEFASLILAHWGVRLADVQGKEAGTHKCDNLREHIEVYAAAHGRRPRVWFVEDRFETLQHVTTHPDLDDVGLFLAAWGYNTPATRAVVGGTSRVRLLSLDQFTRGLDAWP